MKLSDAQIRFLNRFVAVQLVPRIERDGTIMPYVKEARTVEKLVAMGMVRWVSGGKDGYTYNGVVITDSGRAALARQT